MPRSLSRLLFALVLIVPLLAGCSMIGKLRESPTPTPSTPSATATPTVPPPEAAPQTLQDPHLLGLALSMGPYRLTGTLVSGSPDEGLVRLALVIDHDPDRDAWRASIQGDEVPIAYNQLIEVEGILYAQVWGDEWAVAEASTETPADYATFLELLWLDAVAGLQAERVEATVAENTDLLRYAFRTTDLEQRFAGRGLVLDYALAEMWVSPGPYPASPQVPARAVLDISGSDPLGRTYSMGLDLHLTPLAAADTIVAPDLTASRWWPGQEWGIDELQSLAERASARALAGYQVETIWHIEGEEPRLTTIEYTVETGEEGEALNRRLSIAVQRAPEGPAQYRLDVIEVDGTTYYRGETPAEEMALGDAHAADIAPDWAVSDRPLDDLPEWQALSWLVDPRALLNSARLHYVAQERIGSEQVAHLRAAIESGTPLGVPGGLALSAGAAVDVWVSISRGVISLMVVEGLAGGAEGPEASMYIEMVTTEAEEGAPGISAPPLRGDWPETIEIDELPTLDTVGSYRLAIERVERPAGADWRAAQVLYERGRPDLPAAAAAGPGASPSAERLAHATGGPGSANTFAEFVRIGDDTWVDATGLGEWQTTQEPIEALLRLDDLLPTDLLSALGRIRARYVGMDQVDGQPAAHYVWHPQSLVTGLAGFGRVRSASAEMWLSDTHRVPIRIALEVETERGAAQLTYVVTDLDGRVDIPLPEEHYCPTGTGLPMLAQQAGRALLRNDTQNLAVLPSCYRFIAIAGHVVTLEVEAERAELDATLAVMDRDGRFAHVSDGGPTGPLPLLSFRPLQSGIYSAELSAYDDVPESPYTVLLRPFGGTATLDDPRPIRPGETLRAAVTQDALIWLEPYEETIYGRLYTFHGRRGDEVTVTVRAEALGSLLDPQVFLLDDHLHLVAMDDDGYGGLDSLLEETLPLTGRYYLVVISADMPPYGPEESHFYDITLSVERSGQAESR